MLGRNKETVLGVDGMSKLICKHIRALLSPASRDSVSRFFGGPALFGCDFKENSNKLLHFAPLLTTVPLL
jgi:hypothetical protein